MDIDLNRFRHGYERLTQPMQETEPDNNDDQFHPIHVHPMVDEHNYEPDHDIRENEENEAVENLHDDGVEDVGCSNRCRMIVSWLLSGVTIMMALVVLVTLLQYHHERHTFENTFYGPGGSCTVKGFLKGHREHLNLKRQQCPRGGFQETLHALILNATSYSRNILQTTHVGHRNDNETSESLIESIIQYDIEQQKAELGMKKEDDIKFRSLREMLFRVRINMTAANEVEQILDGPIFEYFDRSVQVTFLEVKESKIQNVIEKWSKGYKWTEEEKEAVEAGAMTDDNFREKVVKMKFRLKGQENKIYYGLFAITKMDNGLFRLAFAKFHAEFQFALIRQEYKTVYELFNGNLEIAGRTTSVDVPVDKLSAKAIEKLDNFCLAMALKALHKEGVLEKRVECYDETNEC